MNELIARFCEEPAALDHDQLAEVLATLEADPESARTLAGHLQLQELLSRRCEAHRADFANRVRSALVRSGSGRFTGTVRRRLRRRLRRRRVARWVAAVIAAAAVVTVALLWLRPSPTPWLRVADGELIEDGGARLALGDALRPGRQLQVASGRVELLTTDGSRFRVYAGTAIATPRAGVRGLALVRGAIEAEVAPQPRPLDVTTPDAVLTVLGTRFDVAVRDDGTTVAVHEGRVRSTTDGRSAIVAAAEVRLPAGPQLDLLLPVELHGPGRGETWRNQEPDLVELLAGTALLGRADAIGMRWRRDRAEAWPWIARSFTPVRDWSAGSGIGFWTFGAGRGDAYAVEIHLRPLAGGSDPIERWLAIWNDDVVGWRFVYRPWSAFRRKLALAPGVVDQGPALDRVGGIAVVAIAAPPATGTVQIADLAVYRDALAR